jgi:hypothetical protein
MNRKPSLMLKRFGVLIALAALLVIVPQPATAQLGTICNDPAQATLAVTGATSSPITPISGQQELRINYVYRAPAHATSITPVPIQFTVSGEPSWANVVLDQTVDFVNIDQQGETHHPASVTLTVSVSANAPAFDRARFQITATALEGTCVSGATNSAPIEVTPGFLERWSTRFDQSILQFGQNTAFQIPMSVTNSGNGAIQVEFRQIEREESTVNGRSLDVVVPPGLSTVGSEAQGQNNRETFNVDVQTPFRNGYMNERFPLAVEISGVSADETTIELRPATLRAVVQTQGVFVPGFEVMTALLAMLGIAMTLHMRRRQEE